MQRPRGRPKLESPSEKQLACLEAFREFCRKNKMPPTAAEVGEVLGITEQSVRELLGRLEGHGLVTRVATGPRAIVITAAGEMFFAN